MSSAEQKEQLKVFQVSTAGLRAVAPLDISYQTAPSSEGCQN